jgi:hypothetical protein
MKRLHALPITVLMVVVLMMLGGCDVGVNPLIFDGTPVKAVINVETNETSFDHSSVINLNTVLQDIDDVVDSISVFNITMQVANRVSPAANTVFSGAILINNVQLISVNNLTLADFAQERSVFDQDLGTNVTVNPAGLQMLQGMLTQSPMPTIGVRATGQAGSGPLDFDLVVALYTQVYTTP